MKLPKEHTLKFSIHILVFIPIIILLIFGSLKRVPVPAEFLFQAMMSGTLYDDAKTKAENKKLHYGLALGTGAAAILSLVDYLKAAGVF
ncbi:hypothetical protein ACNQKP_00485 [Bdellovibrio bacteriovorus]|uniref:hypothetical protein n=1 Tax=Bdellovibrio bacteriovorus TaxID=959 RepID=UPI003AA7AFDC